MTDLIVERVISRHRARVQKGIQKYGTTLADNHAALSERLLHIQEEAMDAAAYCEWAREYLANENRRVAIDVERLASELVNELDKKAFIDANPWGTSFDVHRSRARDVVVAVIRSHLASTQPADRLTEEERKMIDGIKDHLSDCPDCGRPHFRVNDLVTIIDRLAPNPEQGAQAGEVGHG